MLKGIDIYMTRIQVMRDWQSDNNRQNTHFDKLNMVSPKVGSFHGTANNTSNNLFNTSLAVNRQDSSQSFRRNGGLFSNPNPKDKYGGNLFMQHKQSATNIAYQQPDHYNTIGFNNFDDTEEGPLNAKAKMNDYSFNNSHMTGMDHPFNQTNKTYLIEEHLNQQQSPSIWKQLFKALRDLFNMNTTKLNDQNIDNFG